MARITGDDCEMGLKMDKAEEFLDWICAEKGLEFKNRSELLTRWQNRPGYGVAMADEWTWLWPGEGLLTHQFRSGELREHRGVAYKDHKGAYPRLRTRCGLEQLLLPTSAQPPQVPGPHCPGCRQFGG